MSTFPSCTGKTLIKILKQEGFEEIRIKGSHHFLRHEDGRCTVVPVHSQWRNNWQRFAGANTQRV